jgi:hypothetical protein
VSFKLVPILLALALPATATAADCPTAPDPAQLPDAAALKAMTAQMAGPGARPTGSAAQAHYIAAIRTALRAIPGVQLSQTKLHINRWTARRTILTVGGVRIPVAGPVPYAHGSRGVRGKLAFVDDAEPITAENARGRIVVRPAPAGSVQNALFALPVVSYETYDPGNTIDPTGNFYGDFINYNARVKDLRDARAAGARAIVFVKELPRRQLRGHYEPYEGTTWGVPGVFLGSAEGKRVMDAVGRPARVTLRVRRKRMTTPNVYATIPGVSPQKLVIDSHTDGTNPNEDNGPVAMVAIARYLAALPKACRPRTIELSFSTAHFYQRVEKPTLRHGGSGVTARRLDAEYDRGLVSAVIVLEHLGAIDYQVTDGELKPTGLRAIQFVAVSQSPALVQAVDAVVRGYDMQRTLVLQGADAPGSTVPSHCSFGGEGTPFNQHLLPTIGVIAAPQSLYDPPFGLKAIDFEVMHSELLGFTELINRVGVMSQSDVAGSVPADRARRDAGTATCPNEN